MSDIKLLPEAQTETPHATPAAADRRRPGRLAEVNPALVPILRQPAAPVPDLPDPAEDWADRAPARGIMLGIAVSVIFWTLGIAALAYMAL